MIREPEPAYVYKHMVVVARTPISTKMYGRKSIMYIKTLQMPGKVLKCYNLPYKDHCNVICVTISHYF